MPLPTSVGLTGDRAKAAALLKRFFPDHSPQQVAAAAGMTLPHLRVNFFHAGDDTLGVEGHGVGETHLTRYFVADKDAAGNPTGTHTLRHESQWVDSQQKGDGHERFAEQLQHLSKLPSVSRIHIPIAAGSAEGNARRLPRHQTTGFYVWPRYGFQGKLEQYHLDNLSPEVVKRLEGKPLDTHSLFDAEGGAEEWRTKGNHIEDLNFDLTPNSEHHKRFKAYYDQRNAKAAGVAGPLGPTAGTGAAVSGTEQAGAAGTQEANRYAAGKTRLERIRQRLRLRYKQEQKFSAVLLLVQGDLRQRVLELANKVPDHLLAGSGRETDPHLTLLYGLHSDDHQPIRDLFSKAEGRIGFRLGKVGVFKNPDFDVLKLEVHSPDAHAVNALLKTQPHTSTYPTYNPHLTLAYVKSGEGERLAKELGGLEGHSAESDRVIFSDPNRNHTPIPVGQAVSEQPAKYNTEPVAHPSVAGFQLEHALRRAISDPETTSELKSLSHTLLTQGVNRSDAAYGIHDEVEGLPEDHWLRKANYNWSAIPHKLHLDAAVGHAIAAVNRAYGFPKGQEQGRVYLSRLVRDPNLHKDLDTGHLGDPGVAAREAADLLLSSHSAKDLLHSLARHHNRERDQADLRIGVHTPSTLMRDASRPAEDAADRYAAKGKNPEGGLTVAEARRQGIEPGSRTKAEAKKAGGFSKIEGKTQARRKSFCARACGQAKQFPKAAKDPESRLRKALRIWGCRCSASKNTAEEEAEKYAKAKPTYSPLVSHAAAVLDDPNLGAVGAFADHLADAYPDHPLTQAMHRWISGESFRDTLQPLLRDNPTHYVVGAAPKEIRDVDKRRMGVIAAERDPVPEGVRAFQKLKGNTHWVEVNPSRVNSSAPINRRKITSAEVAQHLFDKGGLSGLVQAVLGAQHFHPERVAEREQGARENAVTFYKAEFVKYQSPALSDFISAVRQIRSSNQEVRRQIAEQQYKKMGLSALVRDAIADAPHTASANTAQAVEHNGDLDKVRAAATLYAQQTESPQLLLFHEHPEGEDLLHKFDAEGSAEKLRQQLDGAGLYNRTLSPTPTGWSAFFFDPKGEQRQKLLAFTQKAGYNLETSVGTGERVGDGQEAEATKDNRSDYRQFIQQYEKQQGIR